MGVRGSLELHGEALEKLRSGAAELGVELGEDCLQRFKRFATELERWGRRVNLISCESGVELVERHFLDSLAAADFVAARGMAVDLGSGGGFPGVPLAMVTQVEWKLVEARRKRAHFLKHLVRELALDRVEVLEGRAEGLGAGLRGRCRTVTSRGVWGVLEFLARADALLEPGGVAVVFSGGGQERPVKIGRLRLFEEREVKVSGKRLLGYRCLQPYER